MSLDTEVDKAIGKVTKAVVTSKQKLKMSTRRVKKVTVVVQPQKHMKVIT